MQAKISLFSTDVGKRIAYLRDRRGVTLDTLGEGRPTTAQSWERGKMPRRPKWQGIAQRLGLSESFIFMGRLETEADYAFIAKWRNEIEGADSLLAVRAAATQIHAERREPATVGQVEESRGTYEKPPLAISASAATTARRVEINPAYSPRPAEPSEQECVDHFLTYLGHARNTPGGVGVVMWKLQKQFPLDDFATEKPKQGVS